MANRPYALMLLPVLLLSGGCVRIGAKPPQSLLTIASHAVVKPGVTERVSDANSIALLQIGSARAIAPSRVAVRASDNSVAYVKNAVWADSPRGLFHALLTETLDARDDLVVVDLTQYGVDPRQKLSGDLVDFTIDAKARQAVVTFDASLIGPDGAITRRRFTASAPVREVDAKGVAAPMQVAANQVAGEVADWVQGR